MSPLEAEDRTYLDGKFSELHQKVEKVKDETFSAIGKSRQDINEARYERLQCETKHMGAIDSAIAGHEERKHNLAKLLGIVLALIGIVGGGAAILAKIINGGV